MPDSALRNPTRTREFYDNIIDPKKTSPVVKMENGTVAEARFTASTTVLPPEVKNFTSHFVTTTAPVSTLSLENTKSQEMQISTTAKTKNVTGAPKDRQLMNVFNEMWNGVRGMFGIKKISCMNGGKINQNGICDCPQYFNGSSCEKKQCINGGTLQKVTTGPISYECQCPNSLYIDGAHCEKIKCANGASLHLEPNGSWYCDCSNKNFYKGVFCEKFSPPMGFVIPLLIVLVFLLCCGLCRINWCPRKRPERRQEQHSSRGQGRRRPPSRNVERGRGTQPSRSNNTAQEFLLSGDRVLCTRNPAAFPAHGPPYIVRLDTIPMFNPNMIGGVDPAAVGPSSMKPMEPPPSYDQALQAPPIPLQDPPRYTERLELSSLQDSDQPLPHSGDPPAPTQ